MKTRKVLFEWESNFPLICGHTSISFLTQLSNFRKAKYGNLSAARAIVNKCIKRQRLANLKACYPNAELLPVMTDNKLPIALAQAIGLKICMNIYKIESYQRKYMSAMERLLHQPSFVGRVEHNKNYIIVDDIVTQGGTVSALRKHVLAGGGNVVAVTALACACGSEMLPPKNENIYLLRNKFGYEISDILKTYLISKNLRELTNQQVMYLLRFNEIDSLRKKIFDTLSR